MKKKLLIATISACLVAALCVCTACSPALRFVTGGEAGTYYAVGQVIAQKVSGDTATKVSALSGNGSQANCNALKDGDVEFAFSQSDVASYAYNGTSLFTEQITNFSVVAALYMEQVQIVTCDSSIRTVADLAGKRVSIGARGSGVYFNAIDILGAYGITEADITPTYQSFADSADALTNGTIDAAFIVAGAPTSAITQLSVNKQAYLVSLDDAHINTLCASSPFYSKNVIPANTYAGITSPVTTVAISALVLVRNDVSENDVYNFVSTIFNNLDTLTTSHAKFGEFSLEFGSSVEGIPYHAGAAKYFAEKGYTVAD
ncbi:MAG: TAXI family TRAP transporter solute-binding subunit [Eggerthellaceae bacterium]|nr:TAXI family TRAP transporter solute-binding subunit [Eggerthellaceae bacterium]